MRSIPAPETDAAALLADQPDEAAIAAYEQAGAIVVRDHRIAARSRRNDIPRRPGKHVRDVRYGRNGHPGAAPDEVENPLTGQPPGGIEQSRVRGFELAHQDFRALFPSEDAAEQPVQRDVVGRLLRMRHQHVRDEGTRRLFEKEWKVKLDPEPGLRIPNMFDEASGGTFKGLFVQGEDIAQSDPNTNHVEHALESLECLIVQDLFLNETAAFAHIFFPGTSFLEKDGTFTNAERRVNRVRPVMREKQGMSEWEIVCRLGARIEGVYR